MTRLVFKRSARWLLICFTCVLTTTPLHIAVADNHSIVIEQSVARATPPGTSVGVVYLEILNQGSEPVRLTGGHTAAADLLEIHEHAHVNGMMQMRKLAFVDVKPGERVVFEPGGLHLMLLGLQTPLVDGEELRMTLSFEGSEVKEILVPIKRIVPE